LAKGCPSLGHGQRGCAGFLLWFVCVCTALCVPPARARPWLSEARFLLSCRPPHPIPHCGCVCVCVPQHVCRWPRPHARILLSAPRPHPNPAHGAHAPRPATLRRRPPTAPVPEGTQGQQRRPAAAYGLHAPPTHSHLASHLWRLICTCCASHTLTFDHPPLTSRRVAPPTHSHLATHLWRLSRRVVPHVLSFGHPPLTSRRVVRACVRVFVCVSPPLGPRASHSVYNPVSHQLTCSISVVCPVLHATCPLLRATAGALAWPDEPLLASVEVLGAVDGEEWAEARAAVEMADMARHDTRTVQWAAREAMWNEDTRVRTRYGRVALRGAVWRVVHPSTYTRFTRIVPSRTRARPSNSSTPRRSPLHFLTLPLSPFTHVHCISALQLHTASPHTPHPSPLGVAAHSSTPSLHFITLRYTPDRSRVLALERERLTGVDSALCALLAQEAEARRSAERQEHLRALAAAEERAAAAATAAAGGAGSGGEAGAGTSAGTSGEAGAAQQPAGMCICAHMHVYWRRSLHNGAGGARGGRLPPPCPGSAKGASRGGCGLAAFCAQRCLRDGVFWV
jgi:hypothetical protein